MQHDVAGNFKVIALMIAGTVYEQQAKCAASRIRRSSGVVSISTTLRRYFLKGDLSLTCLVFMGSSFRLQLRGATEWDEPGTFIFRVVLLSALRTAPPARTSSRPRHPAPARSGLTRCHAAAARRSIGATL